MNKKYEGVISTVAAMMVLFTAMLDPRVSIVIAVAFLLGLSVYNFTKKGN